MNEVQTKYGTIRDYLNLNMHSTGQPASLLLTGYSEFETPYGTLVPQYTVEDQGRKEHQYVLFHSNGTLRKVPLQDATAIKTCYGAIDSEMVLFYDDGSLKKLFQLTGKLSGFWTEEQEFALAKDLTVALPEGEITAKMIGLGFFKSGTIRSITFWPGQVVSVTTPAGTIDVRTGISFYEAGGIRSLEPVRPTSVETVIGTLQAFDNDPDGISGDMNSLCFDSKGSVSALYTTSNRVIVTEGTGEKTVYEPEEKESLCSESVAVAVPLKIEFSAGKVRFTQSAGDEYVVEECLFQIEEYEKALAVPCYECSQV